LVAWRTLPTPCVTTYKLKRTTELLAEASSFPYFGPVRLALDAFGISYIEARDVIVIAQSLLDHLPDIEGALGIDEALFDGVELEPAEFLVGRHVALQEGLRDGVAFTLLIREWLDAGVDRQHILSRDTAGRSIRLRAELVECSPPAVPVPVRVEGAVSVCRRPSELRERLDADGAWCSARLDAERIGALELSVHQHQVRMGGLDAKRWRCGTQFFATARTSGFLDDGPKARRLLRACAETILGIALAGTHALRTGAGAMNPQRTRRGGAERAWRRDVDQEFHLHYWEGDEGVELASVVTHGEFEIPE
jgi:hypothetical protein